MKKLFLAGVLAASMAATTVASAAVTYGNADTLDISFASDAVSVTEDLSTYSGDQMTVLVLDGNDPATITQANILYIDQDTAPATWTNGTKIFQDMGLYLGENETLPNGTYTVKVGGDNISSLLVGHFTIAADPQEPSYTLGDVNDDDEIDSIDALEILCYEAGDPSVFDDAEEGDATFLAGDVNEDDEIDSMDALEILCYEAGDPSVFDD